MPPEAFAEGIVKVAFGLIIYFILSVVILVSTKKAKWIPLAILAPFIYAGIEISYYYYKKEKTKKQEREYYQITSGKAKEKLNYFCENEFFMVGKKIPKDTHLSVFVQPSEPSKLILEGTSLYNNLMQACTKTKAARGSKLTPERFCQKKYQPYTSWLTPSEVETYLRLYLKKASFKPKTEAQYVFFAEEISTLAERKEGINQLRFVVKDNETGKFIAEYKTFSIDWPFFDNCSHETLTNATIYEYFFKNITE